MRRKNLLLAISLLLYNDHCMQTENFELEELYLLLMYFAFLTFFSKLVRKIKQKIVNITVRMDVYSQGLFKISYDFVMLLSDT